MKTQHPELKKMARGVLAIGLLAGMAVLAAGAWRAQLRDAYLHLQVQQAVQRAVRADLAQTRLTWMRASLPIDLPAGWQ